MCIFSHTHDPTDVKQEADSQTWLGHVCNMIQSGHGNLVAYILKDYYQCNRLNNLYNW